MLNSVTMLWNSYMATDNYLNIILFSSVAVTAAGALFIYRIRRRVTTTPQILECIENYEKDCVYFWTFPRPRRCVPDMSPYGLKVETYLRMTGIKYKAFCINFNERSKKGQIPFIFINGEQYADSVCILNELDRQFPDKALGQNLTEADKGSAQAFSQMMDQATVWTYFWYRYVVDNVNFWNAVQLPFGRITYWMMSRFIKSGMRKRAIHQGTGRNSEAEIWQMARNDLAAISQFLGGKKYLMGDQPAKVDAILFGHLAQIMYIDIAYPHKMFILEEFPNIAKYVDRIKEKFWSDWDAIVKN